MGSLCVVNVADSIIYVFAYVVMGGLERAVPEFHLTLGVRESYALAKRNPAQSGGMSRNSRNDVRREFPGERHGSTKTLSEDLGSREARTLTEVWAEWAIGVSHCETQQLSCRAHVVNAQDSFDWTVRRVE